MRPFLLYLAVLISFSAFTLPSYAKDKGHHDHKHKSKHEDREDHDHDHSDRVIIETHDRVIIRDYIGSHYRPHCPPGLAKKHNGCMPPGQAKKYAIGQRLPDVVVFEPVPQDLYVRLQPVPVGYQYVMVDRDVLLISEASHKVIDAITLLSAVGH